MFDLFPKDDHKQTVRLKRFFMAFGSYVIWCLISLVTFLMGITLIPLDVLIGFFVGILFCNIAIYTMIRTGFSKRFQDPSLTLLQMVIATFWAMVVMYYSDSARSGVLILYLVVFIFGLFKLNVWQFLYLSAFAVVSYACVLILLYKNRPESINSKVDIMNIITMTLVLSWFSFIGGHINRLRTKLRNSLSIVQETELKFRTIFDSASDGITLLDIQKGNFVAVNEKICQMLGYTQEEFLQLRVSDLHSRESLKFVFDKYERMNKQETSIVKNIPLIKKDKTMFYADISGSKITMDGKEYSVAVVRDITEQRQAEKLLEESEKRYRLLADNVTDLIFTMDLNLGFTYISPSAYRVIGYDAAELKNMKIEELVEPETFIHFRNILKKELEKEKNPDKDLKRSRILQFQQIRGDGEKCWLETTLTFLRDENNNAAGIIGTAHDITERKQAEEELKKSEQRYLELSIRDDLTHVYNSRHFYDQLEKEMERANRYEQPLTLLLLDLDKFKDFNDTYGHVYGDYVLSRLGQVIKRCLRDSDSAYRYGGEEFTILLPMTTNDEGIITAQRIRDEFRKEIFAPLPGEDVSITMSIGVAQYRAKEGIKIFVQRVDQLMYQAKKEGRDRICTQQ